MEVDYEGQKKEGKKHGKGAVYYKNGLSYEGQFKNGLRDGYGYILLNLVFSDSITSKYTTGSGNLIPFRARVG